MSHRPSALASGLALACLACAAGARVSAYRLAGSGTHWDTVDDDRVLQDQRPRYPEFFELVLDPAHTRDPDLRPLRDDLERRPVDRRNYDALNALAIAYFELHFRSTQQRGEMAFLGSSFRAAKLAAVPWRAYGEVRDAALREAILDFFDDVASGEKLGSADTASRLATTVSSLERKEGDTARRARIQAIAERMRQRAAPRPEASGAEDRNSRPAW